MPCDKDFIEEFLFSCYVEELKEKEANTMPRRKEERERPLYRVNVMLDQEALDKAKKKAVEDDVRNVANVANTSRFLRWLVERYIDAKA